MVLAPEQQGLATSRTRVGLFLISLLLLFLYPLVSGPRPLPDFLHQHHTARLFLGDVSGLPRRASSTELYTRHAGPAHGRHGREVAAQVERPCGVDPGSG